MRLREMTKEERAVLDELGKEVPEGARVVAGQWTLPYPEQVRHDGVSNLFYNKLQDMCFSLGLSLKIKRGNTFDGVLYFTITIS